MKRHKRTIALLVDNASGHNLTLEVKYKLTNIEILYFIPNCTSHLQPADAGIINSFKCHYKNQLINFYVEQLNEAIEKLLIPDVKQCMYMITNAWEMVTEETIVNCWKKLNIFNSIDSIQNLKIIDSTYILSDIDYKLNFLSLSPFKHIYTNM